MAGNYNTKCISCDEDSEYMVFHGDMLDNANIIGVDNFDGPVVKWDLVMICKNGHCTGHVRCPGKCGKVRLRKAGPDVERYPNEWFYNCKVDLDAGRKAECEPIFYLQANFKKYQT